MKWTIKMGKVLRFKKFESLLSKTYAFGKKTKLTQNKIQKAIEDLRKQKK